MLLLLAFFILEPPGDGRLVEVLVLDLLMVNRRIWVGVRVCYGGGGGRERDRGWTRVRRTIQKWFHRRLSVEVRRGRKVSSETLFLEGVTSGVVFICVEGR